MTAHQSAHQSAQRPNSRRTRLQKFMADAGVASRRRAEEMIVEGRVLVNDEIVDQLPAFVDPQQDRITVDGAVLKPQRPEYFLVHKPKGVVCSNRDPAGRPRAVDLLPPIKERLFTVGRLDVDSSGLLLMTNDGELAQRITHPRYGIPKLYRVEVRGRVPGDLPEQMKKGVFLSEGKARAEDVVVVHAGGKESVLHITLREGRNRQIRRMLARLGYRVKTLKRLDIGPLTLKGLPVGTSRRIKPQELTLLRKAVEGLPTPTPHRKRRGRRRDVDTGGDQTKRTTRPPRSGRSGKPAGRAAASKRSARVPGRGPRGDGDKGASGPGRRVIE